MQQSAIWGKFNVYLQLTLIDNNSYNLRPRQYDRQLTQKSVHINDSLFIIRLLYEDSY